MTIRSKPASQEYRDNYDRVFRQIDAAKDDAKTCEKCVPEGCPKCQESEKEEKS